VQKAPKKRQNVRTTDKNNVGSFFSFLFSHFHFFFESLGKKGNSFSRFPFSVFKATKKTRRKLSLDIINYSLVTDCLDIRSLCNNDDEYERGKEEVEVDSRMGRVMEILYVDIERMRVVEGEKAMKGNEESFISAEELFSFAFVE
jgi:hypothetical protein